MLNDIPSEMITGLVAGSIGAIIRLRAQDQANFVSTVQMSLKQQQGNDDSADKAAKRSHDSWSRRFIVAAVIFTAFIGLLIVAFCDWIPVTYLYESKPEEYLFGLIKFGDEIKSVVAEGFVITPYIKHGVSAIVFFHFGCGAAKVIK